MDDPIEVDRYWLQLAVAYAVCELEQIDDEAEDGPLVETRKIKAALESGRAIAVPAAME